MRLLLRECVSAHESSSRTRPIARTPQGRCVPRAHRGTRLGNLRSLSESHKALGRLDELVDLRTSADEHRQRREVNVRELAVITEQRAELGCMWARRELDAPGWQAARETLDDTERKLTVELTDMPTLDAAIDADAVRRAWEHKTTGEQREIISLFVERVVIERSRPDARF